MKPEVKCNVAGNRALAVGFEMAAFARQNFPNDWLVFFFKTRPDSRYTYGFQNIEPV
jgi:hypothetical protein